MDGAMKYWVYDNLDRVVGLSKDKETARRIVAAVNACEGIETEWLEKHKLEFTGSAIDKIHALKAQNARLLEALDSKPREVGAFSGNFRRWRQLEK